MAYVIVGCMMLVSLMSFFVVSVIVNVVGVVGVDGYGVVVSVFVRVVLNIINRNVDFTILYNFNNNMNIGYERQR